jgi:VWFA-related protein
MKSRHQPSIVRTFAGAAAIVAVLGTGLAVLRPVSAQQDERPLFRVEVDLVVLNVAVTDRRGRYIRELKPADFRVLEDGIPQEVAAFSEGAGGLVRVSETTTRTSGTPETGEVARAPERALPVASDFAGANVFILFDTSNFMYRSFVYAEDAIADFIRGLENADSVAVYGFSRNITRHAGLTESRLDAIRGLRRAVAGDETALYNALLLTLRDAAQVTGRKVVIVFSNGPDTASTVGPDDVGAIAEDEGIPIYVISTKELDKDPISSNAFRRITDRTGGRAYFAKTWQRQSEAFVNIREELGSAYTLTYYPEPNPNLGWRSIEVQLTSDQMKNYRVRTRNGYRPKM